MSSPIRVVVIDGVIGAGKSTLIEKASSDFKDRGWNVIVVKEPVEQWKESGLLQKFYGDPKRYAYLFQTVAFSSRIKENLLAYKQYIHSAGNDSCSKGTLFLLERSPLTDPLFMNILYDLGNVNDIEMDSYREWCDTWIDLMPYKPHLFVYLRPSLDECMRRLNERSREGEDKVSIGYQSLLQDKHDKFFGNGTVKLKDGTESKSIVLETNSNYRDNREVREEIVTEIESIILNM